jgi:N-acetylated-alpha-linked acidic dipeptidase
MAEWTAAKWREAGFDAELAEYWTWGMSAVETSLKLNRPDGTTHVVNLVEDILAEDSMASYPNTIPAFHAMSGSGNVTAEYVYAGYVIRLVEPGHQDTGREMLTGCMILNQARSTCPFQFT